ncbi:hypothetical protein Tco_0833891 [Tanacetum coccineum]
MYSGSPTIQSDDSFPSSSPMKTSDSTPEEFTDEYTHPNSLPPGDDVSILKKDFQEDTFRIISNPLFEFDDSFKSSNMNPLFEENKYRKSPRLRILPTNSKDSRVRLIYPVLLKFLILCVKLVWGDPYPFIIID